MATDITKRLGYGASAVVDGVQVLVTAGGFDVAKTPSYVEPLDVPPSNISRSRVVHADGVEAYTGNVSFDVTPAFLTVLTTSKLLSRAYSFTVGLDDGEDAQDMDDCYVTSLTVSGAAGGLLSASVAFASADEPAASSSVLNAFIRDQTVYGYWYSGNTDVRDWTLTMNQAVAPMYTNQNVATPRYMKVGLVDYSLAVTTYDQLRAHDTINIATASFQIRGDTTSEGFQFVGVTDLGNYLHTFESGARATVGSGDTIIF